MSEVELLRSLVSEPKPDATTRHQALGVLRRAIDTEVGPERTLQSLVAVPAPSEDDRAEALASLRASMPRPAERARRRGLAGAAAVIVLAALTITATSTFLRPSEAVGDLAEVVAATRALPEEHLLDRGEVVVDASMDVVEYLQSADRPGEVIAYRVDRDVKLTVSGDGVGVLIERIGEPRPFVALDDETMALIEPPPDTAGAFGDVSTDLDPAFRQADTAIEAIGHHVAGAADPGAATFELIAGLMLRGVPEPEVRAALLDHLGSIQGVEAGPGPVPHGVTLTLGYDRGGEPVRHVLGFDAAGWPVFEEIVLLDGHPEIGIPPGTVEARITYRRPAPVG